MTIRLKVCCMLSADEADMAIAAGALAVGLVSEMPNGPGAIADDAIKEIASQITNRYGDAVWTTLLTSRTDGDAIADHIALTGVNTVQIVDDPAPAAHSIVRQAHREIRIVQVIHVENESAIEAARQAAETAGLYSARFRQAKRPAAHLGRYGRYSRLDRQ